MQFQKERNRIYAQDEDGKLLAEITFPKEHDHVCINHTFVDDSLRGQGIASMLMQKAVEEIRKQYLPCRATCSYAKAWLSKHPEHQDILLDQ